MLLKVPVFCNSQPVDIDISGGAKIVVNLLLPPFQNVNSLTVDPRSIIIDDLERSGFFRVAQVKLKTTGIKDTVDSNAWKSRGFDALVRAVVRVIGLGHLEIDFTIYDVNQGKYLVSKAFIFLDNQVDKVSHLISDQIYKAFLGVDGYFSSSFAYILEKNGLYELHTSDLNGKNDKIWVKSSDPLLSPKWSPDNGKLAFVSLEKKKPVIDVLDMTRGTRFVLANYKGSNSSPTWFPDGKHLLVVLAKDGFSGIYSIASNGSEPSTVIYSRSIDTEPVYSHDGKYIFFTSDRGGSPQIYRYTINTKSIERVTFDGGYNVSPVVSPDGHYLAYIGKLDGKGYVVMLMDLLTNEFWPLTSGPYDESPSFSPNGQLVMYAYNMGSAIRIVSLLGKGHYEMHFPDQKVITPVWGNQVDR